MKTVNIFSYNELSEQAKENAYKEWLKKDREFFYRGEYIETLKKGLEHFDFELLDDEVLKLTGNELKDYLLKNYSKKRSIFRPHDFVNIFSKNCEFTGVCYDESFLQPVNDFLENPTTDNLHDLMKKCINSLMEDLENDYEWTNSKEYFEAEAVSNDYEYFENGREY